MQSRPPDAEAMSNGALCLPSEYFSEGFQTIDEVVFAEPGDVTLLGVRTLEGFGVNVDYIGHRFIARPMSVA